MMDFLPSRFTDYDLFLGLQQLLGRLAPPIVYRFKILERDTALFCIVAIVIMLPSERQLRFLLSNPE